jgi:hypothetical protein
MDHFMPDTRLLNEWFAGRKKHKAYDLTVSKRNDLYCHYAGKNFGPMISERRPSESAEIKEYREKIIVAKTKGPMMKVFNSLNKIRKSPDWSIRYNTEIPATIRPEETPEKFFDEKFGDHTSMTNWLFQVLLPVYGVDANALLVTVPTNPKVAVTEYLNPMPVLFTSDQVIDYSENKYAFLQSTDKSSYSNGSEMVHDGLVYYFVNTELIRRYEQNSADKSKLVIAWEYKHKLDYLPAFKLGGVFAENLDNTVVWDSRLAAMVPDLKEVIREYSDLQAEVVQHIHSTFWHYDGQTCSECSGRGRRAGLQGDTTCKKCNGEGSIPVSPFTTIKVSRPTMGENQVPTPPAGYIQKDVAIVTLQDKRVDGHIYSALSSINMEFLAAVPLSQSGEAKKTDRDELTTFVNSIAEDLVRIADKYAAIAIDMRYRNIVSKDLHLLRPMITVPDRFDIFGAEYLLGELKSARDAKVNPELVTTLEKEYTKKKLNSDPESARIVLTVLELDPLPNLTHDEKLSMMQNKGITMLDYVLSCNISPFVRRAVDNVKDFLGKPLEEKKKVIIKYAQDIIKSNSPSDQILGSLVSASGETVQDNVLTVAQLAAIKEIAVDVYTDQFPLETGIAIAVLAFPQLDKKLILDVFGPIENFKRNNPPALPEPPAPPVKE